ncbi:hypothetical protein [Nonomuraea jabiensis]|uniref:hypothetical protein n=1 Tax=Nonomuraea jabiensis TaxID=882448 RepID=UPI003D737DF2
MSPWMQRLAGAVGTVAVAAVVNVATGFVTDHGTAAWWVSGGVLLVVGMAVQWWLPVTTGMSRTGRQTVRGTTVCGAVRQHMGSPGDQDVTDSKIGTDLEQRQGPSGQGQQPG